MLPFCSPGGKRELSLIFILEGRNSNNVSTGGKKSTEVCKTRKAMNPSHTQQYGLLPNYQEDVKCGRCWKWIESEEIVMGSSWRHTHCPACLLRKAPTLLSQLLSCLFRVFQIASVYSWMPTVCNTVLITLSIQWKRLSVRWNQVPKRVCFSLLTSYRTWRLWTVQSPVGFGCLTSSLNRWYPRAIPILMLWSTWVFPSHCYLCHMA